MRHFVFVPFLLLALGGCGRLEEHVRHADAAYRVARYADAEEWLERVEADVGELRIDAQTRFYFVQGMSEYRLGRRDTALHYLALARETNGLEGGALPPADAEVLTRTLEELVPTTATHHARPAPAPESGVPAAQ